MEVTTLILLHNLQHELLLSHLERNNVWEAVHLFSGNDGLRLHHSSLAREGAYLTFLKQQEESDEEYFMIINNK